MEKLKMHTVNKADENFAQLAAMFPNAVTEAVDENGELVRAIDKDILMQEISTTVVEGREERYQFTWPNKRDAILLANSPISKTLRPVVKNETTPTGADSTGAPYCSTGSVNFDTTENLYIEGDNLDVLKLLQETYLGKVKMIYIDPPYNTGNDFVYEDDFSQSTEEYMKNSGQFDEEGNRLFKNTDSNGRFHTDWLNMIYPRLKLARDLLSDDGVIFVSIDDNEVKNLQKICSEIFGENNLVATFPWRKRTAKSDVPFGVSQDFEWIVCYAKTNQFVAGVESSSRKYFTSEDLPNREWRIHDMTTQRTALERPKSDFTIINPKNGKEYPVNKQAVWRVTRDTFPVFLKEDRIVFPGDYPFLNISKPVLRYFKEDDAKKDGAMFGFSPLSTLLPNNIGMSQDGTKLINELFNAKIFSYPKPNSLLEYLMKNLAPIQNDYYVLDFFSGSATTAHAVMQLNAEDGGNRKYICVQLPEITDEKSEAYKAGYKNICEIGKERIRRAGAKIKAEVEDKNNNLQLGEEPKKVPDIGFRVLKLDSTNMKDVYYNPSEVSQQMLGQLTENIKEDRTAEDLLFQVMLELGVLLSSKIEQYELAGKTVFDVADGYLIACFDSGLTDEIVTEIAQKEPYYFVTRDSAMDSDSVSIDFEQIFATYSKDTVRKVL